MNTEHPLAQRLDDGRILVRYFTQEPGGAMIDGWVAIGPDDPAYPDWDIEITRWENTPNPLDDTDNYEPIDYRNLPLFPARPPDGHD
ncbi:hypothetical protein [Nocardia sp. NPDC004750]